MHLAERARAAGIHTEYVDGRGELRRALPEVLEAVLAAVQPSNQGHSAGEAGPNVTGEQVAFEGQFDRVWLLTCQLYGLRSDRNWGIGDFSDLSDLIGVASGWGSAGIGLNPLHALFDEQPADYSPYAPNSRLFLNTIYIDWSRVDELDPQWTVHHAGELAHVRRSPLVDYASVAALKQAAAHDAFRSFKTTSNQDRKTSFEAFRRRKGRLLASFACFETLRKQFGAAWWDWPEPWRTPSDKAIDALRSKHPDEMEFVEYAQWIADAQLAFARDKAKAAGMKVGLYLDVAVGVQAGGFDAWYEQAAISRSLSMGAPPDVLNTSGQDWGLCGFSAPGLRERRFEPLHAMLESAMQYAGAIRLDHVLGLRRLYVIPHGRSARDGVYVDMPFDDMAGVIAAESQKHRCIVIGEDLGTVPDGLREELRRHGILSYTVMMFERNGEAFNDPSHYGRESLVTFNTHDLASFRGWETGADLLAKRALGIDPGESEDDRRNAVYALHRLSGHDKAERIDFMHVAALLARAPSRIMAVGIEDLLGVAEQPNIPGTIDEHPNWRRRLPLATARFPDVIDSAALRRALQGRLSGSR